VASGRTSRRKAAAVFRARRASSVGTVTTQDAVYHTADKRSPIARASIVAIARAVTVAVTIARATVIDRTTIVDWSMAVAAPVSGNTAATSEASRMSVMSGASHCASARRMSYAGMTS